MRSVAWSDQANADYLESISYVSAINPDAADRIIDAIEATADLLSNYAVGRPGRVAGTYELVMTRYPYILVYALTDDDHISILRLLHTARDYPGQEG